MGWSHQPCRSSLFAQSYNFKADFIGLLGIMMFLPLMEILWDEVRDTPKVMILNRFSNKCRLAYPKLNQVLPGQFLVPVHDHPMFIHFSAVYDRPNA